MSGDEERRHALLEGFYAPLVRLRDQTPGFGVSLIKAGLRLAGLPVGPVRPPLVDPSEEQLLELKSILAKPRAGGQLMPARITGLTTRLITVPLLRSWGAEAPENHVIVTELTTDDGGTGHGFSWTPTIGPQAVKALLDYDIAPFILGLEANPEIVWDQLWKRLHEAGGGGLTTIAMAGVDLALWDVKARQAGTSVTGLLGQRQESVEVYGSGVNLHYTLDQLVEQARRWVAAGHNAVKIKVGKPELREDAERVAAVRQVIGPDRLLMIDANQRWDLAHTFRALEVLGGSTDWNGWKNPSALTTSGPTGVCASSRPCPSHWGGERPHDLPFP